MTILIAHMVLSGDEAKLREFIKAVESNPLKIDSSYAMHELEPPPKRAQTPMAYIGAVPPAAQRHHDPPLPNPDLAFPTPPPVCDACGIQRQDVKDISEDIGCNMVTAKLCPDCKRRLERKQSQVQPEPKELEAVDDLLKDIDEAKDPRELGE